MSVRRNLLAWAFLVLAPVLLLSAASRSSAQTPMVLAGIEPADEPEGPVMLTTEALDLEELFDPETDVGVLVTLHAENLRERVTLRLPTNTDSLSKKTLAAMKKLLRCHRTGRKRRIDPRVVVALAKVAEEYPGREIVVVSGYRARPYGVPKSRHFRGQAIDFRVEGVSVVEVRDFMWHNMDHVGVGHYHRQKSRDGYVHLDVRPREMKVGWDQRREGQAYRYFPRWARSDS